MDSTKGFRVAIVGGGMCGLACAIGLAKHGIRADVFEAAPEFGQVGAGVGIGLNAIRALDGLGILEPVMQKTDSKKPTLRSFIFVSGPGQHEIVYDYAKHSAQFGLGIYRPAFLDALLPLLEPDCLHLNKKCLLVTPLGSGKYRLDFEDGTAHETDLVIGTDGVKSIVRGCVVGNAQSNLVFTNVVAYRGIVSHKALLKAGIKTTVDQMPLCWMAADKHIITFPMQGTEKINVVLFASDSSKPMGPQVQGSWVETVPKSEVDHLYSDMGDDARIIVDHVESPSKWYIHSVNPTLSSYVSGRVVLVGDSAHGMQPHLGAGVGQGFEDVYVLCRLLTHPTTQPSNLDLVLKVYDELRPRRANLVLEESARVGRIYDSFGKPGCGVDWAQQQLAGIWEFIWHHDLKQEVDEALKKLDDDPMFRDASRSHL
ncbi:FAD/NAD(P)-binding domain-containing protein [Macrolepiota fuliginosa MF-IS2]|uniref:FAD/NAD(P)-binding domain-containing protein n=1 Tax=Macrolepiota fuliginosa MF-IS2 TaxID=1400762 RepID=A0A9P5X9Y5_9AGAR|nr:FAD/NAD(P)-binding domain-containing protein [Macrolepiota fuliginosa MF-IS2]